MKYLKVFTDFVKDMSELGEAERGRLFTAMLIYAESGDEITLRGNERFLWGTAKKQIDSQREAYVERCEINKKNITSRYESLRNATNRYESKEEKEKEEEKEKNKRKLYKGQRKQNPALNYKQTPISEQDYNAMIVSLEEET